MHLLPTQDEVVRVLRDTGALRDGHFEYPNGLHSNEYLQVPLAMRYYQHARQVYWAEREDDAQPMRFRQFLEQHPGEQVVLVDDILRSGRKLSEMQELLESRGARVVALAVIIYQPTPHTRDFGELPLYYLARLNASYYADAAHCDLCTEGVPVQKVWV